jgi:hypothetical protein
MQIARTLIPALLYASLCMHSSVHAEEQNPSEILRPCIEGSSEFNDARKKLEAVDRQILSGQPVSTLFTAARKKACAASLPRLEQSNESTDLPRLSTALYR